MTDVRPFRALRYDTELAPLSRVLAPVYDVVAPEDRPVLWDRDPHSAIRLVLTRDAAEEATTDYADVAERLSSWQREGVLVEEAEPRFWVLRQTFTTDAGDEASRIGFFGALRLEDYAARIVRPHERTLAGPKADRRKLLRATGANLSSIFMLYEDKADALTAHLTAALDAGVTASGIDTAGVRNDLAPIVDPAAEAAVQAFLAERPVVIADGHHRYETALGFRDESGPAVGADRVLAYFANAFSPGTLLLPIHRLVLDRPVPDAEGWARLVGWEEKPVPLASAEALPDVLAAELAPLAPARHAFAADDGSGTLRVFSKPADAELGVRVVHRDVLGGVFGIDDEAVREGAVAFPKSAVQTARDVRAGRGSVALYLNPLLPEEVFRVTEAGETLPQKSTFFQPKLPTGLLFRRLDPDA